MIGSIPARRVAKPRPALSIPAWLVLGTSFLWLLVVLGLYYSRPRALLLSWVGLAPAPTLPELTGVSIPQVVDWSIVAHLAWSLAGVALLSWVTLALGAHLSRLLRLSVAGDRAEALTAAALGLGAVAYLVFGLAALGWLQPAALVLLGLALIANAAVWTARGPTWAAIRSRAWPRAGDLRPAGWVVGIRRRPIQGAAWLLLGLFLLTAFIAALAPEVEYDALWYHLFLPRQYLAAGRLIALPTEFVSLYPQTAELLYALGLAWDGPVAAKLIHFVFGLLTVGATYRLARRFLPPTFALVAGLIFLSAPTAHWELGTAHIELATALFATLAVTDLIAWWDDGKDRRIYRAALLLGLALSTKHLALLFLLLSTAIVFGGSLRHGVLPAWPRRSRAGRAASPVALDPRRWLLPAVAFTALALLIAAPWYVRSWLETRNPVFPLFTSFFGAPPEWWNEINSQQLHLVADDSSEAGFGALLTLPWTTLDHPGRYLGSPGPLFLWAVPFVALGIGRGRAAFWLLGAWVAGFFLAFAAADSQFQVRYLVPVFPALAVLAAAGLAALVHRVEAGRGRRLAAAILPVALAVMALNLPPFLPWHGRGPISSTAHEIDPAAVLDRGAGEAYIARHAPAYRAIAFANQYLPENTKILTFLGGVQYYSRYPLLMHYTPAAQPATWNSHLTQDLQVIKAFKDQGITHVLLPIDLTRLRQEQLTLTSERFMNQYLTPIYHDDLTVIWEVRL